MIRTPQELSEPIRRAVNRRAVLFSHIMLAVTVAAHTILATDSGQFERVLAVVVSSILTIFILLRVFDFASVNNHPRVYLAVYYTLIFFAFTFLSDASTPYVAGIFMLVFLTNLYYGSKGVIFSIGFFGFVTLAKYIYFELAYNVTLNERLSIIVAFFVFTATASIFINLQKVFDWDHERLGVETKKALLEGKRLRALINNLTESVLVLDKTGRVRLYNAAALALFDTNINLENKVPEEFATFKDDKGNKLDILALLPATPTPLSRSDVRVHYSDDDFASLSITITPIQASYGHEDEEETGFIVTLRDITREKSLEDERNEFISVISHELRTPVTVTEASISNAMIIHEKTKADKKLGDSLKLAHDQAVYLANLLNDLSTFARAEKNSLELSVEVFDPTELVTSLVREHTTDAEAKNMKIVADIVDGAPEQLASNRLYLREILQNFITNAIKYSDEGTVTLRLKPQVDGVRFEVADQGIGISTSDQKRVFDKFFRSEDFHTRSRNGTGLGLYIVRKLAKILGATFDLQSDLGKGSTFSLIVPDQSDRLPKKKTSAK